MSRTAKPEQGLPTDVRRMVGLETAAKLVGGQEQLAGNLGISSRALRHKLAAGRGISDGDIVAAADALDQVANRIMQHAGKLRGLLA